MQLYIPKCGDAATLNKGWTFSLQPDRRNVGFYNALFSKPAGSEPSWSKWLVGPHLLPAGTELVFDRIYIRQHNDEYASVTFIVKGHPTRDDMVGERFWVKLEDANRLDLEFTSSDNPVGGFAKEGYRALLKEQRDPTLVGKREAAAASKEALAFARDHVRDLCMNTPSIAFETRRHVDDLVEAAHRTSLKGRLNYDRSYIRMHMQTPPRRKNQGDVWHVKSKACDDGTVVRELRFVWDGHKHGGFQLTIRGNKVVSCQPLA